MDRASLGKLKVAFMPMDEYVKLIVPINISAGRKSYTNSPATKTEVSSFRKLAGEHLWMGGGVLSAESFFGH